MDKDLEELSTSVRGELDQLSAEIHEICEGPIEELFASWRQLRTFVRQAEKDFRTMEQLSAVFEQLGRPASLKEDERAAIKEHLDRFRGIRDALHQAWQRRVTVEGGAEL